jgi:peptide/nickel transport system permease protein
MQRQLMARLVQALVAALLIGSLCFAMMQTLPGDAAMRIAASRYGPDAMTQQLAEAVRAELGLERPWLQQYGDWLGQLARLDLGHSLVSGAPVIDELRVQLGHSLWLALLALALSLLIGPPLGLLAGRRPNGRIDRLSQALAILLRSVPPFVLGLLLMLVFSLWLGWLPPAGFGSWRHLLLPALTLALGLAALSSRVTRDAMAEVGTAPYFAYGRYKGLGALALARRHGVRNAAIPVVAYLGLQTVYLIEGVVVVESIFAFPGIGHALVHAVIARDVPMVQGTVLVMGLLFILINLLVDALCRRLDPRLGAMR